jgi:hypothetical protein
MKTSFHVTRMINHVFQKSTILKASEVGHRYLTAIMTQFQKEGEYFRIIFRLITKGY